MNQKRNRKSSHFLSPLSAYVTFQENLKMHTLYGAQHTWLVNHCIFLCDTVWVVTTKATMAHRQVPGEAQCEPPSPCILPGQGVRSSPISAKEMGCKPPPPPCFTHRDLLSVLQSMGGSSNLQIKSLVKNRN